MVNKKVWAVYTGIAVLVVGVGGGYYGWKLQNHAASPIATASTVNGKLTPVSDLVAQPAKGTKVDKYTLTAEYKTITLSSGKMVKAMTFNGSAPGPLLSATQGDLVQVTVHNHLRVPITIHWHGIDVPGAEDGVPGLTQNPIQPGDTYKYKFVAKQAGTYWYHSHDNSVQEVGEGLFGGIVIQPKTQTTPTPEKDYTLLLHEWSTSSSSSSSASRLMESMSNMSGMSTSKTGDMSSMNMGVPSLRANGFELTQTDRSAVNEMSSMYNPYTINQAASGQTILDAKPEQTVRLRLVNTGNMTHLMTLVGVPFKVVAMDGQDISNPTLIDNELLPIGAAERYDIEFMMPKSGNVQLVSGDPNATERMGLHATIGDTNMGSMSNVPNVQNEPWFDFTNYGSGNAGDLPKFSVNQHFDKSFNMTLGVAMGKSGMEYTINGKTYPDVPPFVVNTDDTVKVHIINKTNYIHPMHLHGHHFQVLTRDGKPVTGSTVYLDTLEVLPGETYDIAFKADNPGLWMFHCHDLHHAAAGMDVVLQYSGVSDPYNTKDMSE